MRIGIDARPLEWQRGAVARFTLRMLEHYSKEKKNDHIILFFQNYIPDDLNYLKEHNFELILIKGPKLFKKKRAIAEQLLLPKAIKKSKCDIFLATNYSAPLFTNCPIVLCLWDITYSTYPNHYKYYNAITLSITSRLSAIKAKKIITCSNFDAQEIINTYKVKKNKILIVEFGLEKKFKPIEKNDEIKIQNFKKKHCLPDKFILALGVIYNRRNIDKIIEGFIDSNIFSSDISLVVIGRNATVPKIDIETKYKAIVKANKGFYMSWAEDDELVLWYQAAYFYITTSKVDGESMMLKEAISCGTPVVTSPLLKHSVKENCLLVNNPDNKDDWVTLFNEINEERFDINKMINKGIRDSKDFLWSKLQTDVSDLIYNVVKDEQRN